MIHVRIVTSIIRITCHLYLSHGYYLQEILRAKISDKLLEFFDASYQSNITQPVSSLEIPKRHRFCLKLDSAVQLDLDLSYFLKISFEPGFSQYISYKVKSRPFLDDFQLLFVDFHVNSVVFQIKTQLFDASRRYSHNQLHSK